MALIKCAECGKEISDKATRCVHCGYSIQKGQETKTVKLSTKIWLIICAIVCFLISAFCFVATDILKIFVSKIIIGSLSINVMGILALLLGSTYITLLNNLSKKNFYLLVIINTIVFICNFVFPSSNMFIKFLSILCAVLNLFITLFIVKKDLNNSNINFKDYVPFIVALVLSIITML